ncbi:MAG: hypothetical protein AB7G44_04345 [Bacteroidia bacterium]
MQQPENTLPYPLEQMLKHHSATLAKTDYSNLSRWRTYSKQHIQKLLHHNQQLTQKRNTSYSIIELQLTNEMLSICNTAIIFNERFLQLITEEIDRRADMIPMELILKQVAQ